MAEYPKAGYDFDPYKGEETAPFFLGTWIGKITGDNDGFISTYREWHIMLAAINAGARAGTFENVPECPPLFKDEEQYWNTPAMVTNVIKCNWPTIAAAGIGILTKINGVW